ncbi:lipopolysaccharide biosynthesis protein [Verrucomicrobia bacterium]|nr:lipopolysaccharide biosynthesis protein [Verrucomicrobiota bacterium]
MKLNTFLKESAIYSFSHIFNKFGKFLLIPFLARELSKGQYGELQVLILITVLVENSVCFGVRQASLRLISEDDKNDKSTKTGLFIQICLGSALLVFFLGTLLLKYGYINNNHDLLLIICVYGFSFSVFQVGLCYLRAKDQLIQYALFSFLKTFSDLILIVIFVQTSSSKPLGYIHGLSLSQIICVLPIYFTTLKNSKYTCYKLEDYKKYVKFAFPILLHVNFGWLLVNYDKILVKNYIGHEAVALLAVGLQFASIFKNGVEAFLKSLYTQFYTKKLNIEKHFNNTLILTLLIGGCVTILCSIWQNYLIFILAGNKYNIDNRLINLLLFSRLLMIYNSVLLIAFYYKKNSNQIMLSTFFACLTTIIISTSTIKEYGILVSGYSAIISYGAIAVYLSFRCYSSIIKFSAVKVLIGFIIVFIFLVTNTLTDNSLHIQILLTFILFLVSSGLYNQFKIQLK